MKDFFELYESLPKSERQAFRKRMIESCLIESPTWYGWMRRKVIPRPSQKLISIGMKKSIEELFPNKT
jgi:hypothetical protein